MGGIFGAALVYANYYHAINVYEGGHYRTLATAGFFGTYAVSLALDLQVLQLSSLISPA